MQRVILQTGLAMVFATASMAQTEYYWTNGTSAWSDSANWTNDLGGAGPTVGSNDYTIVFGGTGGYVATQDMLTAFLLNRLVFNGVSGLSSHIGTRSSSRPAAAASSPAWFSMAQAVSSLATPSPISTAP